MNGRPPSLLQILARMPASLWLRAVGAVLLIVALAVFGLALLAGVVAVLLLAVFGFKARDFLGRIFGRKPARPPVDPNVRVQEAEFVIVDRRERP